VAGREEKAAGGPAGGAGMKALLALARAIDSFNDGMGRLVAWLTLAMVLVTVVIVVLRYGFNVGFIWMQESVRFMHAMVFLLCSAYTLLNNAHVRVDVFYLKMGERGKAWVDLFGSIAFLIPVCTVIIFFSWDYVLNSWANLEGSLEERGLHAVFLLKTSIWIFAATMIAQALSRIIHAIATIRGFEHEQPGQAEHAL
jgi:TRAP-type mannitol/chloroaromatic compound transport system permease small subunit